MRVLIMIIVFVVLICSIATGKLHVGHNIVGARIGLHVHFVFQIPFVLVL